MLSTSNGIRPTDRLAYGVVLGWPDVPSGLKRRNQSFFCSLVEVSLEVILARE